MKCHKSGAFVARNWHGGHRHSLLWWSGLNWWELRVWVMPFNDNGTQCWKSNVIWQWNWTKQNVILGLATDLGFYPRRYFDTGDTSTLREAEMAKLTSAEWSILGWDERWPDWSPGVTMRVFACCHNRSIEHLFRAITELIGLNPLLTSPCHAPVFVIIPLYLEELWS